MSQEIVDAVREIEREKGIESGTLVAALEDALLAAYKKTPGASRHATVELDDKGDFRVFAIELPDGPRGAPARRGARARDRRARAHRGGDRREEPHAALRRRPRDRLVAGARGPDQARGRDAGQLRPDRRADRQAGDPAADPRGRARDDVRRVHRPRRRGRHRHRPADRRPPEHPGRPRQGRGAAARARAGRRRALRAGLAHQGGDPRGPHRHEGPAGDPLAPRPGADQDAVRARGARDRRRPRRDPRRRPRAGLPLEDRRRVARAGRRPGRRLRRPARLARPHGRLGAPRREDRHHPVEQRAGAVRREGALAGPCPRGLPRRRGHGGDGRRARRPARARDRQGGHERPPRRTPHRLEDRHHLRHASSRSRRPRRPSAASEPGDENDVSGRCAAVLSNGKRCPNAALPGSKYCGVPAHQELALHETDDEDNPIVAESEPELEALSDTAEPEPVTEDAAAFGNPEPEEFPAGPGRRPGRTARTRRSRPARARAPPARRGRPDDGVPIPIEEVR